ncbi:MAG TPA: FAD-dependent oxidoreductase [Solirubrobacterales bacterium]|nr:FAD-dependent oxidoreductase [Solirubrobacterales bacterium]
MSGSERIVIVGGGPAAKAAAEAYREAGGAGTVTILAREADPPYERPPLTKDFLRGETGREELTLADPGWYEERAIGLRTGTEVAAIDLGGCRVLTAAGDEHPFDRLLLATGAEPPVPPIPGADGPGVQTLRRIGDSERLGELRAGDRALVAGSGFIGCEAAASLAMRGVAVTVATLEAAPQVERLGPEVAAEIGAWLGALGVELLAEAELADLRPAGDRSTRARFTDRHEETVDRVVLALGVERDDGLAAAAGLPVEDGIEVDATMATPDPRVLAAGDVAFAFNASAGRRLRVEHWGEALNMGEVAGKTMAGAEAGWRVAPGFWSTIGEHTIKYAGWGDGWDVSRFEPGDDGTWVCRYGRGGELVGVAAHRDDDAYERGRELIEGRAQWS